MVAIKVCMIISLFAVLTSAAPKPQDNKPNGTAEPQAQFVFDILPDASDLVTRLGSDCDVQAGAQAESSSSSFSMVLPGGIAVSASFSEARAAAGSAVIGTPSPFRGRGVSVTGPGGVTYYIKAPIEADFRVQGPEGTKWAVRRQAPTSAEGSAITFPKH